MAHRFPPLSHLYPSQQLLTHIMDLNSFHTSDWQTEHEWEVAYFSQASVCIVVWHLCELLLGDNWKDSLPL